MPIEIRELLIRAFVGGNKEEDDSKKSKKENKPDVAIQSVQNTLAAIKETINREKER